MAAVAVLQSGVSAGGGAVAVLARGARPGGRRSVAASAVAGRVAGIESGERQRQEAEQAAAEEPFQTEREGQRPAGAAQESPWARPGCYELFIPSRRSPQRAILFVLVPPSSTASDPA